MVAQIDRERLRKVLQAEEERFLDQHPRSRELFEEGRRSLLAGAAPGGRRVLCCAGGSPAPGEGPLASAAAGEPGAGPDKVGPPVDLAVTTKAIEWNDTEALEAALAEGDIACVLAEPAMTNI